jgi:hypothetical protein
MSTTDEDSALIIFYKLKHLFIEDNMDDEYISALIASEPIKIVGEILLRVTEFFDGKVTDMKN